MAITIRNFPPFCKLIIANTAVNGEIFRPDSEWTGGVLLDLEDLAAKYAPDLNIPQSLKDWYRAGDGKWYSIANFYYGPERTNPAYGGYYATHQPDYARQDIPDQIGMKLSDLETKAGFLNALRAARDKKIQ